ncbi:MAG: amylo-alpha-1,6-glucosidase [Candidatus Asgardarchaeia archaeon]
MGITIEERNLPEKTYVLSGKQAFFHRFCDSSFKTKWTGLWVGPKKFLDYFAFKIDDSWLSPNNCFRVEYDELVCTHIYKLEEAQIRESLFVPETGKALFISLKLSNLGDRSRKFRVELEVGVNMRELEENWHDRRYQFRQTQNSVLVNSSKGSLIYGTRHPSSLLTLNLYKDHYPGELERCFIPGILHSEVTVEPESYEEISFMFTCGEDEKEASMIFHLEKRVLDQKLIEKKAWYSGISETAFLKTGINEIDNLFKWSVMGLEKLLSDSPMGSGVFAGYPWFTQFWGRDSGWVIPAIVNYGNFECAKEALKTLASFQSREGEIPNTIHMYRGASFGSSDATPLWISALAHYVLNSGDVEFLKIVEEKLIRAVEWCRTMDSDGDGLLEVDGKYTWMDTLKRNGKPVDLQAIWFKALTDAKLLLGLLDKEIVSYSEIEDLKSRIEEEFWNESVGFYYDRIESGFKVDTKTVNSIFPVLFEVSKKPLRVIEQLESDEFTGVFGVRTFSKSEEDFNPVGYHTGSAWGRITGLMACVEFLHKRVANGFKYLSILNSVFGRNCLCSLDEAWNADNADPVLLKGSIYEPSAVFQAWSFGSVIRCIDEYMLGLKVDAINRVITVSASLRDGMKVLRRKRVGDDLVDLRIEKLNGKLKVRYESKKRENRKTIVRTDT